MSGRALKGLRTWGPSALRCLGGADFEDGGAVRRSLQSHGVAVALDSAGTGIGQCRDDFSFRLGAGACCLFLGIDGALAGGDEAINGAQRRLVEAAGAGCWNSAHLGGDTLAAIGADDALLGDNTL